MWWRALIRINLNARFSKVCEIFKVHSIESLKYRSGIVVTFPRTKNVTLNETSCDWLFDMSVNGLMGGPWPINAAIYSRPSAVSLKVWLRETSKRITSTFSSKNGGNFQGMQVAIATCFLKITCSDVSGLPYFRAISACVIYWWDSSGRDRLRTILYIITIKFYIYCIYVWYVIYYSNMVMFIIINIL